ncbi:hypothetical protein QYS46_13750 [Klebsiella michiganensis]|nr:hypothetical protein [Klebsiella michiganensis]
MINKTVSDRHLWHVSSLGQQRRNNTIATEYVDYLILGDEHHGEIHRDIKSHSLRVRSKYAAGSVRGDASAEQPKMVNYNVHEYPAQDGRFYLVATNYPLVPILTLKTRWLNQEFIR